MSVLNWSVEWEWEIFLLMTSYRRTSSCVDCRKRLETWTLVNRSITIPHTQTTYRQHDNMTTQGQMIFWKGEERPSHLAKVIFRSPHTERRFFSYWETLGVFPIKKDHNAQVKSSFLPSEGVSNPSATVPRRNKVGFKANVTQNTLDIVLFNFRTNLKRVCINVASAK